MEEIKTIVFAGLKYGWAYNNIISQIAFNLASVEELDSLKFWCNVEDLPELIDKAKKLYNKYYNEYKEKYFKTNKVIKHVF